MSLLKIIREDVMDNEIVEYFIESDLRVCEIIRKENCIEVKVEETKTYRKETICSKCKTNEHFKKGGTTRLRKFKDVPYKGNKIIVSIVKKEFVCNNCGTTITENSPFFYNKNLTTRMKELTSKLIKEGHSNLSVAKYLNLDEKSIRRFKQENTI